jgi:hypothetical protein
MQQFGKDNMDMAMKSFGAMSQGFQAIAAEVANYSKKSFEDHAAAIQKIMDAKSIEKAMELQTEYMKHVYEGFVAIRPRSVSSMLTSLRNYISHSRASPASDLKHTVQD